MESSTAKGIGIVMMVIAGFVAFQPIMHIARSNPSIQNVQEAKGSSIPFAYAYDHASLFFAIAGILFAMGILLWAATSLIEKRKKNSTRRKEST